MFSLSKKEGVAEKNIFQLRYTICVGCIRGIREGSKQERYVLVLVFKKKVGSLEVNCLFQFRVDGIMERNECDRNFVVSDIFLNSFVS